LPVVALAVALAGCGDGRLKRYPVTGSVVIDGKPAEGAIVAFCPVNPSGELEHLRPAGRTDGSGRFELTTYDSGDGAPAGEYKVLVKWPAPEPANDRDGRPGALGPDRLKGKYYDLEKTPFAATIEEQANELAPFELKSR
jgi:hypothetical protein